MIDLSVTRMGSALSDILAPSIFLSNAHNNLKSPMWYGQFLILASFIIILVVYVIDYLSDSVDLLNKIEEKKKKTEEVVDRFFTKKREKMNEDVKLEIKMLSE